MKFFEKKRKAHTIEIQKLDAETAQMMAAEKIVRKKREIIDGNEAAFHRRRANIFNQIHIACSQGRMSCNYLIIEPFTDNREGSYMDEMDIEYLKAYGFTLDLQPKFSLDPYRFKRVKMVEISWGQLTKVASEDQ